MCTRRNAFRENSAAVFFILALTNLLNAQNIPEDISAEEWNTVRAVYESNRHAIIETDTGYKARNPGQAWQLDFDGRGFLVEPDSGDWSWGLELARLGFADSQMVLGNARAANTRAEGGRVTYEWSRAIDEWYINDARGFEHGFTIHERPAIAKDKPGTEFQAGPLTLSLRVRGTLSPVVQSDRRGVNFVDSSGVTALSYFGLTVFDAKGSDIPAWFETDSDELNLLVDDRGAEYPLVIDPIAHDAYIKASNASAGARFGFSTTLSGHTLVVGAFRESGSSMGTGGTGSGKLTSSGAVYVFVRTGSTWSEQAILRASNAGENDMFGVSVAISGDTLVVGADGEDSHSSGVNGDENSNDAKDSGAAYVFVRNGTSWSQQAYLKASNTGSFDFFGEKVAIDNETIVVSATNERSNATGVDGDQLNNESSGAGAAYVFVRNGLQWSQQAYLKASNTEAQSPAFGDSFGWALAISNDTILVGAPFENSDATGVNGDQFNNNEASAGAVYVFVRSGTTWQQQAYLKASDTTTLDVVDTGDAFGISVAISGDSAVVGARGEDGSATGVNGDDSDNTLSASGAAYVFVRNHSTWSQQAYLKASNPDSSDQFGISVGISDDTIVVCAYQEDSAATGVNGDQSDNSSTWTGAAYVFVRSGLSWSQRAYLKPSNTQPVMQFGNSASVSGSTICIGASNEYGGSSGINGDPSAPFVSGTGAVYAYQIPPAFAANQFSISLSSGGQQDLTLEAGLSRAGWFYSVFGSLSGSSPGINLGSGINLPLNFDRYFLLTLNKPDFSAFGNFNGQLDSQGIGMATFSLPPSTSSSLAGVTLRHAYVAAEFFGLANFASNAVPLTLVP